MGQERKENRRSMDAAILAQLNEEAKLRGMTTNTPRPPPGLVFQQFCPVFFAALQHARPGMLAEREGLRLNRFRKYA
jgi:hypothetical protein